MNFCLNYENILKFCFLSLLNYVLVNLCSHKVLFLALGTFPFNLINLIIIFCCPHVLGHNFITKPQNSTVFLYFLNKTHNFIVQIIPRSFLPYVLSNFQDLGAVRRFSGCTYRDKERESKLQT